MLRSLLVEAAQIAVRLGPENEEAVSASLSAEAEGRGQGGSGA
jgi:hypothetical protein